MKGIIKIALTNWVNIVTIFIIVYISVFISSLLFDKFTIEEAIFGTTYSVFLYGMIIWIAFFVLIVILDVLLFSFNKNPQYTDYKLVFEWALISLPFIYWVIKYNQWIFLIGIIAFMIGQYIRRSYIFKILSKTN